MAYILFCYSEPEAWIEPKGSISPAGSVGAAATQSGPQDQRAPSSAILLKRAEAIAQAFLFC